jgi:hypothetical protein
MFDGGILDLPIWLLLIVCTAIVAMVIVLRCFQMPRDYAKRERQRSEIRSRLLDQKISDKESREELAAEAAAAQKNAKC